MNDCHICFDFQADISTMVYLECTHSLCNLCLDKLEQNTCPFCRFVIKNHKPERIIGLPLPRREYKDNCPPQLHIRVRRRRRRRPISERLDDNIILETSYTSKRSRKKQGKNRKKKAKWSCKNARNRGNRTIMSR